MGTTHPNPSVGAVITSQWRILGEGKTCPPGGDHAEIVALRQARQTSEKDIAGSTVYVSLEPCNHHGRTPPCTDALIEARVGRVVIASSDPNPEVDGGGAIRLQEAGISVETGCMSSQANEINQGFFKRMNTGLPWVRVKSAQSLDGRTALPGGESKWISCDESRKDVQRWRARSSAILTGIGTVLADDPRMTVRPGQNDDEAETNTIESHSQTGLLRQPLKVIVDSNFRSPPESRIFDNPGEVVVVGSHDAEIPADLAKSGVEILQLPAQTDGAGGLDLRALLQHLGHKEINEVQVEAGSVLCGSLLRAKLIDEILIYQAPVLLGQGGPAAFDLGPLDGMDQSVRLTVMETRTIGSDLRIQLKPVYSG
jgi:diaminohydroxyphosphoribosylaminopyrimidine deaminase/5-amino-6-(5-phosphoribosylamino)uracil reductase